MKGPAAPTPPDPYQTAGAQTNTNIQTALANSHMGMVNQVTPYGSLTYTSSMDTPASRGPAGGPVPAPAAPRMERVQVGTERTQRQVWDSKKGQFKTVWDEQPKYEERPVPGTAAGGGNNAAIGNGTMQITGPDGQTYNVPRYTATTTLSPAEQRKLELTQAAETSLLRSAGDRARFLEGYLKKGIDTRKLPKRGTLDSRADELTRTYVTDFSADRQRVEDALMGRLDTRLNQDREALETRLINQGIRVGSEAWTRALEDFGRNRNDARTSAILGAGQEQSRLAQLEAQRAAFENAATQAAFGMDQSATGFNNQAREAGLAEIFALRNQPINEITALMSGSQVNNPNVSMTQPAQMPTVDMAGLINQNYGQQMDIWRADQQRRQDLMGGLFGLGAGALSGGWF